MDIYKHVDNQWVRETLYPHVFVAQSGFSPGKYDPGSACDLTCEK